MGDVGFLIALFFHDTVGFHHGDVTDLRFHELLIRWFRFSVFSPVMRTMFCEFPEDPLCWELDDQSMLGSKYLVAPVLYEGMQQRKVYLPAGQWKDIHSGDVLSGGQTVTADTPLDVIPVFERIR